LISIDVIRVVAGVSSFFGVLSVLAYLYFVAQARSAERSVRDIIEGEGLFNSDQVVNILAQFTSDARRLEALKEIAHYGTTKAASILEKIKSNVDLGQFNRDRLTWRLRQLSLTAAFFLALAVLGFGYASRTHSPQSSPTVSQPVTDVRVEDTPKPPAPSEQSQPLTLTTIELHAPLPVQRLCEPIGDDVPEVLTDPAASIDDYAATRNRLKAKLGQVDKFAKCLRDLLDSKNEAVINEQSFYESMYQTALRLSTSLQQNVRQQDEVIQRAAFHN
jgi:hypothetical protein